MLRGQLSDAALAHHTPAVDDDDVVGQPLRLLEGMRRHDDRAAGVPGFAHQVPDVQPGVGVQARRRLVQKHDLRSAHESRRKGDTLLLSSGQTADSCPAEGADPEAFDKSPNIGRGLVERGQVAQQAHGLGAVRQSAVLQHDSHTRAMVGAGLPWVGSQDADLAGVRAKQAFCALNGRGLACAVGSENRGHLPMVSSPRHTREGGGGTKSLGEIAHGHCLGHGRSLGRQAA